MRLPSSIVFSLIIASAMMLGSAIPTSARTHIRAAPRAPLETVAITFLNPSLGWRLAAHWDQVRGLYGPLLVGQTKNGGLTWPTISTIPGGMLRHQGMEGFRVSDLRFASPRDGWAYGTALYSTHDSGKTWKTVPITSGITNISIAGRSVWRLDERCTNMTCRNTLLTSTAGSDRWQRATVQPLVAFAMGGKVIRANVSDAWVLGSDNSSSGHIVRHLLGTRDGGKTWRTLSAPCGPQDSIANVLVFYGSQHLWAFCAVQPSAGQELKTVDRSDDGGRHWRLVSATGQYGLRNLSSSGYVNAAALTSPSSAWLALGRGTLLHTGDGGRTWRDAIPYFLANPKDAGVGPILFADPRHGWLLSFPSLLFRTVDGGRHWQKILLP